MCMSRFCAKSSFLRLLQLVRRKVYTSRFRRVTFAFSNFCQATTMAIFDATCMMPRLNRTSSLMMHYRIRGTSVTVVVGVVKQHGIRVCCLPTKG